MVLAPHEYYCYETNKNSFDKEITIKFLSTKSNGLWVVYKPKLVGAVFFGYFQFITKLFSSC